MTACYEVLGVPKIGGKALVLRRFAAEPDAIAHALKADMAVWDDVWVVPSTKPIKPEPTEPPPFPWNVLWCSSYAYVIDADGKKIAALLGSQKQREFVAEILCDLGAAAKVEQEGGR